ncbi:DUF4760 domain-containing protein [Bowmanella sp. Y26]|uniref:DUF4760 domain-containing protein n=1 Tax=Bowmanella yangjiangensis TaxID=2811230 RepID=UPI001BDD2719|nr:DUF4760 domain-containing protein [Bowmanella yangjiangensis]MBT1065198.1 DUF4760 domain-containing protein [Bowmanella yangjiangensis]
MEWLNNITSQHITTILTAGILFVAYTQLRLLNYNETKFFTMNFIKDFEKNNELRTSLKNIQNKVTYKNNFDLIDMKVDAPDVYTVLNFFDSLAIGVEQEILIESLVYDYLHHPLKKAVEALILGKPNSEWTVTKKHSHETGYEHLIELYNKWEKVGRPTAKFKAWNPFS